jgi:alkaline phosphatase D
MEKKTELQRMLAHPLSRRQIINGAGVLAGLMIARELPVFAQDKTGLPDYPFTLGVASGDPSPDGVVLWTRLAPNPVSVDPKVPGGFNSDRSVAVSWEVASDPNFRNIVQKGNALAARAFAHSIHVELRGLKPSTFYWYRFKAGQWISPVGRTKTAPAQGAKVNQFKFAFVSCADYQNGYFTAYRDIAAQDLDLVVHLGDYIYEYGPSAPTFDANRKHNPSFGGPSDIVNNSQMTSLEDYRNRHALYRTDPDLQKAHAAHPWVVTFDDHEVENNYADDLDEIGDIRGGYASSPTDFLIQRANAYRAYYEHMPIRQSSIPIGPDMQIYRRLSFGSLATFHVLDTRQYRTDQPLGIDGGLGFTNNDFSITDSEGTNPTGTLLGDTQEQWLTTGLAQSQTTWNILANQVMMARFNFLPKVLNPSLPNLFNFDQWDGYATARQRLLDVFVANVNKNVVVITGDIHSSWVHDLKASFANPRSTTVGTELICTSITSSFPADQVNIISAAASFTSPWTKFFDATKGYTLCTLTPSQWRADFRVVPTNAAGQVQEINGVGSTLKSFVIQSGVPGAKSA